MGRGKIQIKRIENLTQRQVTYSKRSKGIIKKVEEICILCKATASLIIVSGSGKLNYYCSSSNGLAQILEKYHSQASAEKLWDAKHENLNSEIERLKKENDGLQIKLRHLEGKDISSLNHLELIPIVAALENGLSKVREKKNEVFRMLKMCTLQGKIELLEEENRQLLCDLERKNNVSAYSREFVSGGYQQAPRDYLGVAHMPVASPFQLHPDLPI